MPMEIYMKENGKMTKHTVLANISILTDHCTRAFGKKISNTDMAKKSGPTVLNLRDIIKKARNTVKARLYGLMAQPIKENSTITIFMGAESTAGPTVESIMGHGKGTRCTDLESLLGLMGDATKENIKMIRSKAMVHLGGQMEDNILEIGTTENSMVSVNTSQQMEI